MNVHLCPSMFDNEGKMRIVTTKSTLKTKLYVTRSQGLVTKLRTINTGCLCYPLAESRSWGRFRQRIHEERDGKGGKPGYSSDDCAPFEYNNAGRGRFLKFVDGAPRLPAWQLLPTAPASYRRVVKAGARWLCQSQTPLGIGRRSDKGSRALCPNMAQFLLRLRGIHCLAADSGLSYGSWYDFSMFVVSRGSVADTLRSVHVRHETPICWESTMLNNTLI